MPYKKNYKRKPASAKKRSQYKRKGIYRPPASSYDSTIGIKIV